MKLPRSRLARDAPRPPERLHGPGRAAAPKLGAYAGLCTTALLAALFLRGPQTAGELRINSERLHRFGDILAVEAFLHELEERPLVRELAKAPGARETRWVHLLSGEPAAAAVPDSVPAPAAAAVSVSELAVMKANLDQLQQEVAALRATVARLCQELGIAP
ncbi:MAG TPA: DUF480 domain-containing protein [Gaiellaceae bacterium]